MFTKNKIMTALIISSLQASAFAASYGSYEYTLENEWEPVWPSGLQNEMGYSATGLGCGEVTTGDEGEEKWEQPDLKYLTETAEREGGGNAGEGTHLILQLHGADAATTASESLFVKDIHNNTWFRLGGIAEDATFVNANGEAVREGDYTPISDKLTQGSEVKLSIIAPYSESKTEGGLLAGYNLEQLKGVLERVTLLLDAAGPITKSISIDILASGKKAVNAERPGSIHRELADMLTNTFKEHGADVTLRLRGKATREVMIEGKKVNQILIDGEWKSDSEELFRNQLRETTLEWDSNAEKYQVTSASQEEISQISSRLHALMEDPAVRNKAELINDFVDRFAVNGAKNTTDHDHIVGLLERFVSLKASMQYINNYVNRDAQQGVLVPDIDESIRRGVPVALDTETGTTRELEEDSQFMHETKQLNAFLSSKDVSNLNINQTGSVSINEMLPHAESASTMDAAFLIKMLMDSSKTKYGTKINSDVGKVIFYTQLTQTALGVINNGVKFGTLAAEAAGFTKELSTSVKTLSRASEALEGVSQVFNVVTIGMDIWSWVDAKTPEERFNAETQFGVDTGSIVVSLGLMASGYGELAAPVAGIGIGVSALVEAYRNLDNQHKASLKTMGDNYSALTTPYTFKNGIWTPNKLAVIKSIDLNKQTFTLGSSYVHPITGGNGHAYTGYDTFFNAPRVDRSRWLDFYKALDQSKAKNGTYLFNNMGQGNMRTEEAIVLPYSPVRYYSFKGISQALGLRYKGNKNTEAMDKIKARYKNEFYWRFYALPTDWTYDFKPIFSMEKQKVEVIMNNIENTIIVPGLNSSIRGKLSYLLKGTGGGNNIILNHNQPTLTLESSDNDQWNLDLSAIVKNKNINTNEKLAELLNQIEFDKSGHFKVEGKEYAYFIGSEKSMKNITVSMKFEDKLMAFRFDGKKLYLKRAQIQLSTEKYKQMDSNIEDIKNISKLLGTGAKERINKVSVVLGDNKEADVFLDSNIIVLAEHSEDRSTTKISIGRFSEADDLSQQALPISAEFDANIRSVDIKDNDIVVTQYADHGYLSYKLYNDDTFRPSAFVELDNSRKYISAISSVTNGPTYNEFIDLMRQEGGKQVDSTVQVQGPISAITNTLTLPKPESSALLVTLDPLDGLDGAVTYRLVEGSPSTLYHATLGNTPKFDGKISILSGVALYSPVTDDLNGVLETLAKYGVKKLVLDVSQLDGKLLGLSSILSGYKFDEVYITGLSNKPFAYTIPKSSSDFSWYKKGKDVVLLNQSSSELPYRKVIFSNVLGSNNKGKLDANRISFKANEFSLAEIINNLSMNSTYVSSKMPVASVKAPGSKDKFFFWDDGTYARYYWDTKFEENTSYLPHWPKGKSLLAAFNHPRSDDIYFFWSDGSYRRYSWALQTFFKESNLAEEWSGWPENKTPVAAVNNPDSDDLYFFWSDGTYGRYDWSEDKFNKDTSRHVSKFHGWPAGKKLAAAVDNPGHGQIYFFWTDRTYAVYEFDNKFLKNTSRLPTSGWPGWPQVRIK